MSNATFTQIFGPFAAGVSSAGLQSAGVDQIELHRGSGWLHARLLLDHFVAFEEIEQAERAVAKGLALSSVEFRPLYPADALCVECFPTIVSFLRRRCTAVNGTFRDAACRIDGETMTVTLRHGGLNVLKATKTDAAMGALIAELFQRRVALVFDGEERVDEQDEGYRKMMEAAEQEAAMRERARAEQMAALRPAPAPGIPSGPAEPLKPKKPADPAIPPADGLPIYLESAQSLFGPVPRERPTPLRSLTDDGGNVTVWGEVFEYETKAFRDGTRIRHTFSVTDGTSSVTAILWTDIKRDRAKLEAMEAVKKGVCLLLSGLYEFDVFAKSQVLTPKSMAIVARYVKRDNAPEKRVELHLHTKMSAMDAVSDAEALIARAADWGHKEVRIHFNHRL